MPKNTTVTVFSTGSTVSRVKDHMHLTRASKDVYGEDQAAFPANLFNPRIQVYKGVDDNIYTTILVKSIDTLFFAQQVLEQPHFSHVKDKDFPITPDMEDLLYMNSYFSNTITLGEWLLRFTPNVLSRPPNAIEKKFMTEVDNLIKTEILKIATHHGNVVGEVFLYGRSHKAIHRRMVRVFMQGTHASLCFQRELGGKEPKDGRTLPSLIGTSKEATTHAEVKMIRFPNEYVKKDMGSPDKYCDNFNQEWEKNFLYPLAIDDTFVNNVSVDDLTSTRTNPVGDISTSDLATTRIRIVADPVNMAAKDDLAITNDLASSMESMAITVSKKKPLTDDDKIGNYLNIAQTLKRDQDALSQQIIHALSEKQLIEEQLHPNDGFQTKMNAQTKQSLITALELIENDLVVYHEQMQDILKKIDLIVGSAWKEAQSEFPSIKNGNPKAIQTSFDKLEHLQRQRRLNNSTLSSMHQASTSSSPKISPAQASANFWSQLPPA